MIPARRTLQTRLMIAFAAFTLLVAAMFGLYAMVFTYSVEDAFFTAQLEQEAEKQLRHHARTGEWASPRDGFVRVHAGTGSFPADIRRAYAAEPWRKEFGGEEGRHYHVHALTAPSTGARAWLVAEVSDQLVVRPMRTPLLLLLATTGLGLVAIALGLGFLLARRTAGPLARLAGMVDTMTPGHVMPPFAHAFADDEVGILARGLEGLVTRVQVAIAREQEFTRDASHELRTPLTVIRSAAERLLYEPALSPAGRRHLAHVQQSAIQLEQTVGLLLSLAREAPLDAVESQVAVVPLLERIIIEQAPLLEGKPVEVRLDVSGDTRLGLPASVAHVLLSNLIGNAFGHTSAGEVCIDVAGGRLRITNAGDVAAVSGNWARGEPFARREGSSGFGLGLAIVRRLCERYAVDLHIEHSGDQATASIALAGSAACDGAAAPAARTPHLREAEVQ